MTLPLADVLAGGTSPHRRHRSLAIRISDCNAKALRRKAPLIAAECIGNMQKLKASMLQKTAGIELELN